MTQGWRVWRDAPGPARGRRAAAARGALARQYERRDDVPAAEGAAEAAAEALSYPPSARVEDDAEMVDALPPGVVRGP